MNFLNSLLAIMAGVSLEETPDHTTITRMDLDGLTVLYREEK